VFLFIRRSHEKELGRSSGWIFLDSANKLFLNARLRVFGKDNKNPNLNILQNDRRRFFDKSDKGMKLNDNHFNTS
jgi:hypothetical protein